MPMFRKKPVTIEAVQWTGQNDDEVVALRSSAPDALKRGIHIETYSVYIHTHVPF